MAKSKKSQKAEDVSIEEALERLERIVQQLEGGKLPLEKAIDMFVEGMGLLEYCQKRLDEAEQKIQKVIRQSGKEWRMESFDLEAEENGSSETESVKLKDIEDKDLPF